jgi:hypothetical protein
MAKVDLDAYLNDFAPRRRDVVPQQLRAPHTRQLRQCRPAQQGQDDDRRRFHPVRIHGPPAFVRRHEQYRLDTAALAMSYACIPALMRIMTLTGPASRTRHFLNWPAFFCTFVSAVLTNANRETRETTP